MSDATPAPGWYADPYDPAHQRYWDGNAWAEPSAASPVVTGRKKRKTWWIAGAVVAIMAVVAIVASVAGSSGSGSASRRIGLQDILSLQFGTTTPSPILSFQIALTTRDGLSGECPSSNSGSDSASITTFQAFAAQFPSDIKDSLDHAADSWRTALTACANRDETGVKTALNNGDQYMNNAVAAIKAHCKAPDSGPDQFSVRICT